MSQSLQKADLRRSLLKTRQSLSFEIWHEKSKRICFHLQNSIIFAQSHTILAYFSTRQEPDLKTIFTASGRWGFPRCVGETLVWHLWSPTDALPLQSGKFGIPEPHPDAPTLNPSDIDLILVPAVACDQSGYRLGYGGGFYDRLLSEPAWAKIPTIGIVFHFAYVPELPIDPWDRPLTGVCTEEGMIWGEGTRG
jgi:5-formyltetrahydrofolate cyclo-ligase